MTPSSWSTKLEKNLTKFASLLGNMHLSTMNDNICRKKKASKAAKKIKNMAVVESGS